MNAALEEQARQPDHQVARAMYREHADGYDVYSLAAAPLRHRAVALLDALPGDVVLDVGCGTGLNFAAIQAQIGPAGWLIGVDPSAEMLAKAEDRVIRQGWRNVSLVNAPAEQAPLRSVADAALFSLVHDVLRSPAALRHVLSHVRPGGRIAACGAKRVAPHLWWAPMLDGFVLAANAPYITTEEGLHRPWSHLERLVPDLEVAVDPWDVTYVASGTVPQPAALPH